MFPDFAHFMSLSLSLLQNKKLKKVSIPKINGSLGMRLLGGKGSKYGDVGIYICGIESNGAAER